jgi:signal transduction histidine kinase
MVYKGNAGLWSMERMRRIGIRTKLVVLMVVVALVPLLAALAVLLVGERTYRQEAFGRGLLSLALSEKRVMEIELEKDIEMMGVAMTVPSVLAELNAVTERKSDVELKARDTRWSTLTESSPEIKAIQSGPIARVLGRMRADISMIAELRVTDRFGQIVAATDKCHDYYQADEEWWVRTYNAGEGAVYIPSITLDKSTRLYSAMVCVPIMDGDRVIGVVKAVLDLNRWQPGTYSTVGIVNVRPTLVGREGFILHSQETMDGTIKPFEEKPEGWEHIIRAPREGSWEVRGANAQAYTRIQLPHVLDGLKVNMSPWILMIEMPIEMAHRRVAALTLTVGLLGVLLVTALFVTGVLLIDRSIINRIRRISDAARIVAGGELHHRADARWAGTRLFGVDEIDRMARDFNNMVRKLHRGHDELLEANQLKEDFIRVAGHELRTPVSFIVGMARLIRDCDDIERLHKAIDTMAFKAGRLDEVIQSMFKLIPEKHLGEQLSLEPIDLHTLLRGLEQDMRPWIERRKQTLIVDASEGDLTIRVDRMKLRDVLENLAMNAVKFTPDGGVITIRAHRQLGDRIRLDIEDTGPGIRPADQPHVFEPFFSGGDTLKHSTGKSGFGKKGIGLGLSIVRHFVEMHHGQVSFVSSDAGTTFTVVLPSDQASPEDEFQA